MDIHPPPEHGGIPYRRTFCIVYFKEHRHGNGDQLCPDRAHLRCKHGSACLGSKLSYTLSYWIISFNPIAAAAQITNNSLSEYPGLCGRTSSASLF